MKNPWTRARIPELWTYEIVEQKFLAHFESTSNSKQWTAFHILQH